MGALEEFEIEFLRRNQQLQEAKAHLERYIRYVLEDERVLFHSVDSRVKGASSVVRKLAKKLYERPWDEMMDLIGVRVLTYFRSESPVVEAVLRKHFAVDDANSLNKADELAYNEFGYTSRHLICSVDERTADLQLRSALGSQKFEVQIRTVLEHGWAEIEHELVYKAGTKTPENVRRRFAASAAALELIEREFAQLRGFESDLIKARSLELQTSNPDVPLDRAWFVAVLETEFPGRMSWSPKPKDDNFYHGLELAFLDFLARNGVSRLPQWRALLQSPEMPGRIERYASFRRITPKEVNHMPIAWLACSGAGPIQEEALLEDPDLAHALNPADSEIEVAEDPEP